MKRLMMFAMGGVLAVSSLMAETWYDPNTRYTWTYRINGDVAELYNGYDAAISPAPLGAVTIPSELGNKPVTSIGDNAFLNCSGLTRMTIPSGVTNIGEGAFYDCSGLTSVTLPAGLTNIGNWAFDGCSGLTSITIPEGMTSIGDSVFAECCELTDITIPGSVTDIGDEAFWGCSDLTNVTIPEGVTNIGNWAFCRCGSLTSIEFLGNAPTVGKSAFSSVGSDCTAYVKESSMGWDVEIPGTWNGIRIEYLEENPQTYVVSFDLGIHGVRTGGGELVQMVRNGSAAIEPDVVSTNGWAFTGWDCSFTNVTTNIEVRAQYKTLDEKIDYYVFGRGLQETIEMAKNGSTILVYDGDYGPIDTGNKTLTIRSVNGADRTFINGKGRRCALLGVIVGNGNVSSVFDLTVESFGATLEGFTLECGSRNFYGSLDDSFGGGVAGGTVRNCVIRWCSAYLGGGAYNSCLIRCEIVDCSAYDSSYHNGLGGGAYGCSLDNCLVHSCSADGDSGGLIGCDVYSSTVTDNTLWTDDYYVFNGGCSGGMNFCNVSNSIVWGNTVKTANGETNLNWVFIGGNYVGDVSGSGGFFANSCTYPMPSQGMYNITNDPQFVDAANGNYRLQSTSPCIDAAGWAATNAVIDLAGKPRVSGIAPDIGAYEYQYVVEPIPELPLNASSEEVAAALSGSVDAGLVDNITNAAMYAAYREWALAVKDANGVSAAGAQAVKGSPYAWLSFALGADRLVPDGLTSDDIRIESFKPTVEDGVFAFTVSIAEVGIGEGLTITEANREAIIDNLERVLGVEGSTMLDESAFSSANIAITFDMPVGGKSKFSVRLPSNVGKSFFLRVKVK